MKFSTTLISLAIASSAAIAPSAFAQSADLSITGKIFPGACVVELGNGGVADLGNIRKETLNTGTTTLLEPVLLPASVSCESEVRFALQAIDNVAESAPTVLVYGLGMTPSDQKIGGMDVGFVNMTIDGGTAYQTRSSNGGQTWSRSEFNNLANFERANFLGFAKVGSVSTGPASIANLTADLRVRAKIQPGDQLTIDDDVPVNGNVTINLHYL